jgi:hypothetical protein
MSLCFATRLSFRISRYGVTWTSLGITRWRPAAREGFPDIADVPPPLAER